jgi:hypothetical protein
MISHLLKDLKLDSLGNFALVETGTIEAACSELDVEQLKRILKVYTNADDMFTQRYLHGRNENIKTLVDIGKSVEQSRDEADVMYGTLTTRETLYFRCLVEAFRAWYRKTQPLTEVKVESDAVAEVPATKPDESGLCLNGVKHLD